MLLDIEQSSHGGSSRSMWKRGLRIVALALGALVFLAVGAVLLVLVLLDTPTLRGLAANKINAVLGPSFRGRIHIDRIGHLGIFGVRDTDVTIYDPSGASVVIARGSPDRSARKHRR